VSEQSSGTVKRPEIQPRSRQCSRAMGQLYRDRRGAAMTEYVALLGTVCITAAAAISSLGPYLVANYERSQGILLAPFP